MSNPKNSATSIAYQAAIDLLMADRLDYKELIVRFAKSDPVRFVALVNGPRVEAEVSADIRNILGCLLANRKVDCIKSIRVKYGCGLKEAKDVCDNLQDYLSTRCDQIASYSGAGYNAQQIFGQQVKIFNEIIAARGCVGIK